MSGKTATLIGATGLIGNQLYELLKQDHTFERIRLIVRRPFTNNNDRTEVKLVDFEDAESFQLAIEGSDVVFCTVGTTQRKVNGDRDAYRKVDFDIPVKAARFCKMTGCEKMVLVSSVGASSQSKNFYLKLKGEVEDAIKEVGLRSVHIIRPSMLLGDRKEFRLGEKIGQVIISPFSFLLPSRLKPIQAKMVAMGMLNAAKDNNEGFYVHEYNEIRKLNK